MDAGRTRRRWARRVGALLLLVGVLGLVEVGLTMFWQEPFSSLTAKARQNDVADEVDRLLATALPQAEARRLARLGAAEQLREGAARAARTAKDGAGLGRIEIPSIDVDWAFVEGTDPKALNRGPGHYPKTDLPGQGGTVGIAGHRTTYGAPFRHIDRLRKGDELRVTMAYGTFTYAVERLEEVTPDRVDVVRDVGRPRLVLSACTPLFSSARRIIVYARQVKAEPRAPGTAA